MPVPERSQARCGLICASPGPAGGGGSLSGPRHLRLRRRTRSVSRSRLLHRGAHDSRGSSVISNTSKRSRCRNRYGARTGCCIGTRRGRTPALAHRLSFVLEPEIAVDGIRNTKWGIDKKDGPTKFVHSAETYPTASLRQHALPWMGKRYVHTWR